MVKYQSYDAEGKGIWYFIKDSVRYRPITLIVLPFYAIVVPAFTIRAWLTQDKETESFSRFRTRLIVYRDDSPKVRNIIKFDEEGKRIHLEPRVD